MVPISSHDGATGSSRSEVPVHPVEALQGPFEESIVEAMTQDQPDLSDDNLDAGQRRAKLLHSDTYTRVIAGRWKQKPGEKYHPLWKLSAQLSFGIHLLAQGIAKSDDEVMQILQNHVDDVDNFLERTSEDIELGQRDIQDRLEHLRLPFSHIEVFDRMLEDRNFRNTIVAGNEKIEHIVTRTTAALKDALKDSRKGLEATRSLLQYLESIKGKWRTTSPDFEAVYVAMFGNCEGWNLAFRDLIGKADRLSIALVQLSGVVDEMQRRCGIISRKGLMGSDMPTDASSVPSTRDRHGRNEGQGKVVVRSPQRASMVRIKTSSSSLNATGRPSSSSRSQQQGQPTIESSPKHRRQASREQHPDHKRQLSEEKSQVPRRQESREQVQHQRQPSGGVHVPEKPLDPPLNRTTSQRNRLRKRPSAPIMKYKSSLMQKQGMQEEVVEADMSPSRSSLSKEKLSPPGSTGNTSERSGPVPVALARKDPLQVDVPGGIFATQQKRDLPSRGTESSESGLARKPSFTRRLFGRKLSLSSSKPKESFVAAPTAIKTPRTVQKKATVQNLSVPPASMAQKSPALPSPDPGLPTPPGLVSDEQSKSNRGFFTALPATPSSNSNQASRAGSSEASRAQALRSNPPLAVLEATKMAPEAEKSPIQIQQRSPSSNPSDRPALSRRPSRFKENIDSEEPIMSPGSAPSSATRSLERDNIDAVAETNDNSSQNMPAALFSPPKSHKRSATANGSSTTSPSSVDSDPRPPRRIGIPRQSSLPSLTRTKLSPPTEAPPPPPPGGRKLVEPNWSAKSAFHGEKSPPSKTRVGMSAGIARKVSLRKKGSFDTGGKENKEAKEGGIGSLEAGDKGTWFSRMGKDGVWVAGEAVR